MRLRAILRLRLRSLFSGARADRELDEELQYHLDRQIEEYLAAGMTPAEARSAAIGSVAGLQLRREECRDMRGVNPIDHALKDLAFALRQALHERMREHVVELGAEVERRYAGERHREERAHQPLAKLDQVREEGFLGIRIGHACPSLPS